jgi:bifunctional non-homologous end joining protein LigD
MAAQRKPGDKAPYPGFVEPALATDVERVPNGERWSHEIKFDGYRVQVHLKDAVVKVYTRRGNDWTNRFKKILLKANRGNYRALVADVNLGGTMDGWAVAKHAREIDPAFPIIYMTGC